MSEARRYRSGFTARQRMGPRVIDWLRGLDKEDRRAIGLDLMRVQFGWPIGRPWWEPQGWSLGGALIASEPADSPAHPVLS
jgi:hypothetical protein